MFVILATALMIVEVFTQLGSLNSAQRLPPRDVRCPLTDWGSRRLPGGTMVLPSMQTFFILVLFFGGSKEKKMAPTLTVVRGQRKGRVIISVY